QVPNRDLPVARDAVHRLIVDGDADRAGEPVIAEKAGRGPALPDQLVGDAVELDRFDPRLARLLEGWQDRREQAARAGHQVALVGGLEVDHAVFVLAPSPGFSGSAPCALPAAGAFPINGEARVLFPASGTRALISTLVP